MKKKKRLGISSNTELIGTIP